jgi:hypothetical protein
MFKESLLIINSLGIGNKVNYIIYLIQNAFYFYIIYNVEFLFMLIPRYILNFARQPSFFMLSHIVIYAFVLNYCH